MLAALQAKRANLAATQTSEKTFDASAELATLAANKAKAEANNVDKWYDALKDVLIPSLLLRLPLPQAKALSRSYESKFLNKPALTEEEEKELDNLASTIEEQVEAWKPGILKAGFFVRLNTRSPKDALILHPKMFAAIQKDKDEFVAQGGTVDENAILRFCYVNFVKQMVVHSGKEAVELLAISHRIWQDIEATISSTVGEFEMYVVAREWAQIHPSLEFRGFVYDRKLNAISSYNRAVCWPGIPERKQEIEDRIKDYWKWLEPKIPEAMQNFVIDFAFLEDTNEITVVEFNDFADFEGAATNAELFSWKEDWEVLTGQKPLETRLVMEPLNSEQLENTLTKPFRIHLGWAPVDSWKAGVDWY